MDMEQALAIDDFKLFAAKFTAWFFGVAIPFLDSLDLELRSIKWVPITLLAICIVLVIFQLLRNKRLRKRYMSPSRRREADIHDIIAKGITDAVENAVDHGKMTENEANFWYHRIGRILSWTDIMNQKIVVDPYLVHMDVLDPHLPVTTEDKEMGRDLKLGEIVRSPTLKERIKTRMKNGFHMPVKLPDFLDAVVRPAEKPKNTNSLANFGKSKAA